MMKFVVLLNVIILISAIIQASNLNWAEKACEQAPSLCALYHDHLTSVAAGVQTAWTECKWQFRYHRWNCTANYAGPETMLLQLPAVQLASREAAFSHSVGAAGVAHAVARACRQGILESCSCSSLSRPHNLKPEWLWSGCGDNLHYGYKFSQSFVDVVEWERKETQSVQETATISRTTTKPQKIKTRPQARRLMNLHNNEAGRRAVLKLSRVTCKCHGVSGSCTLVTCWQQLAPFREIGDWLRNRYERASQVRMNRRGRLIAVSARASRPGLSDLVYIQPSPSYCSTTIGRSCNHTAPRAPGGCDILCCGRGFESKHIAIRERCRCRFKWCCHVECGVCTRYENLHTCK